MKETKRLHYQRLDVFTDRAFGGNQLAVFLDGGGIPDTLMQRIANELNLSETTFVRPPRNPANDFEVRIFTPAVEMPMAGHPTIGTAFVLAREGLVRHGEAQTTIIFEERVGPIPVEISWKDGAPDFIEMRQPLPEFGACLVDVKAVAETLSLDPADIRDANLPPQIVSCGVPYLIVPVASLAAMRRIRFQIDAGEELLAKCGANVFAFSTETEFPGSDIHSRMFAPGMGVIEDPATGSASGPLGCYLVRHGVLPSEGDLRCVSEQGIEMGRPSFIQIRIVHAADQITEVRVGGRSRYMGAGYFDVEPW